MLLIIAYCYVNTAVYCLYLFYEKVQYCIVRYRSRKHDFYKDEYIKPDFVTWNSTGNLLDRSLKEYFVTWHVIWKCVDDNLCIFRKFSTFDKDYFVARDRIQDHVSLSLSDIHNCSLYAEIFNNASFFFFFES